MLRLVRLFMVPDAAAGTRSGAACASARRTTSTMRCEVSTFPPATAAGGRAFTIVPLGAITSMGRIKPAGAGKTSPHKNPKKDKHAGEGNPGAAVHPPPTRRTAPGEVPTKK